MAHSWNYKGRINKTCVFCNTAFQVHYYRKDTARFCSKECQWKLVRSKVGTKEYRKALSKAMSKPRPTRIGEKRSMEVRQKISKAKKGKTVKALTPYQSGEKHWNWKGGITPVNKKIRITKDYILWRTAVFMRDDYTCQSCNVRGGKLEADHIKPFSLYPELRLAIDNGRTLCRPCHLKTDTWGGRVHGARV